MSVDPKFGRFCDECGRTIVKAVRVHNGCDYCRACYQRTFLPVPCSSCNASMRVHKRASTNPVCDLCTRSKRTCLRCGKLVLVAGKLIGKSAVCAACTPRFAEKRICPQCSRLSPRLSRPLFAGLQEAVCARCRNQLSHATCAICRRYRRVALTDGEGARHCADCIPGQQVEHPCPSCEKMVKGGGLGRCRECIGSSNLERDAALVAAELEAPWCEELWRAYVEGEKARRSGSPRLRKQVYEGGVFFRALAQSFVSLDAIDATTLSAAFDSKFLRHHLAASNFVLARLNLDGFDERRAERSETQHIANILDGADFRFGGLLQPYASWLERVGTTSRTARLYLRAASNFCSMAKVTGKQAWPESAVVLYLKKSPGQAASLGRFVSYCRTELCWEVRMPPKAPRATTSRSARDLQSLRHATKATEGRPESSFTSKELARILSLTLGIPAAQLNRVRAAQGVRTRADGSIEIECDAVIDATHPLFQVAQRWAELAKADEIRRVSRKRRS